MKSVLLTCGIGDCICVEACWTDQEKKSIDAIHWASRAGKQLMPIFARLPSYDLKLQVDHWDYSGRRFCFIDLHEAARGGCRLPYDIIDRSISAEFNVNRTYQRSSLLDLELADVSGFGLPRDYAVVVPYTPVNGHFARITRDFRNNDWDDCKAVLKQFDLQGVVVNMPCPEKVPPGFINLTGKTTLDEAIEIVKGCSAYVGIDSWASVLASMVLPANRLRILARNPHLYAWRHKYYPTHRDFSFVGETLRR